MHECKWKGNDLYLMKRPISSSFLLCIILIIKYTIRLYWHSYIKRGLSVQILYFYRFVGCVGWIHLLSCPVPVSDWVRVACMGHVLHDKWSFSARSLTLLHTNTCLYMCVFCAYTSCNCIKRMTHILTRFKLIVIVSEWCTSLVMREDRGTLMRDGS